MFKIITLYSTGCAKCNILEKKICEKKLNYLKEDTFNPEKFTDIGIFEAPILYLDDKDEYLDFSHAIKYINSL